MKNLLLIVFMLFWMMGCEESTSNNDSQVPNVFQFEMDFFSTGATYVLDEKDGNPFEITDVEFDVSFSSVAGSMEYDQSDDIFRVTFDNPEVLGKLIRGTMSIGLSDDLEMVGVYVNQTRQYESLVSGSVLEDYEIALVGIPITDTATESTGEVVYIYELTGQSVCNALTSAVYYQKNFETINQKGKMVTAEETLTDLSCGERSNVTVRVYLPEGS
jgi:hypothetical protein